MGGIFNCSSSYHLCYWAIRKCVPRLKRKMQGKEDKKEVDGTCGEKLNFG